MTQRLKVALSVRTAISARYDVMYVSCHTHASLTLTHGTQWMAAQVHGPDPLPPAAVATLGSRAPALVDLVVTLAP